MITVLPDPAGRAGTAQMRVGGAAAAAAAPGLRIRREGWDQGTLGPNGWQGEDALLQPDEVATDGADLLLTLGWPVCAHLEAGTYLFGVPRAGVDEPASWPDIRPVRAASRPRPPAPAPVPVPVPQPQPPAAEPAPMPLPVGTKPEPRPAQKAPAVSADPSVAVPPIATAGRSKLLALLPVLVLLLAGGGYWYWSTHRATVVAGTTPPAPSEVIPPHPPVPEPPPSAPSLADMSVPDVLSHAANPAAIAAEGQRRLAGPKRDEGMLLLEEAADRSDGSAMASLGALYDPVNFQPSPTLGKPDPRQAARYYRDAQHAGMPGIDAKRDALLAWLRARSANGDLQSDLIQRDFWP